MTTKLKILFLGNSHTYFHDLPQIFKMLAEAGQDIEVEARLLALPGVPWSWHLSQEVMLRYEFLYGGYDYVVMQQASHRPFPPAEETLADGKKIIARARQCGIRPILCMSWAERRAPQHQQVMFDVLEQLAAEENVPLEPTGYLFQKVAREYPDIDLHFLDGEHCSPYGSYLRALGVYGVIFGETPVGLPARSIRNETTDEAAVAQAVPVLQSVQDDPEAWTETPGFQAAEKTLWRAYALNWDKESCYVDLDPAKARILQELVAEKLDLR